MNNYLDLYVDDDEDFVFTDDGDIQLAEGGRVVAQDVKEGAYVDKGDLVWSPETGKGLRLHYKDNDVSDRTIIAMLRSEAITDIRIDPDTVKAGYNSESEKYFLNFSLYNSVETEKLLFDKDELLEGSDVLD